MEKINITDILFPVKITEEQLTNLGELARFLEEEIKPKADFSLSCYLNTFNNDPRDLESAIDCGTVGCVLGWSCFNENFRSYLPEKIEPNHENIWFAGFSEIAFGLSEAQNREIYYWLFFEGHYDKSYTIDDVIFRIKEFVSQYSLLQSQLKQNTNEI